VYNYILANNDSKCLIALHGICPPICAFIASCTKVASKSRILSLAYPGEDPAQHQATRDAASNSKFSPRRMLHYTHERDCLHVAQVPNPRHLFALGNAEGAWGVEQVGLDYVYINRLSTCSHD
jgi:hypothetical protein